VIENSDRSLTQTHQVRQRIPAPGMTNPKCTTSLFGVFRTDPSLRLTKSARESSRQE
jgi:hypothetical protein